MPQEDGFLGDREAELDDFRALVEVVWMVTVVSPNRTLPIRHDDVRSAA